MKNVLGKKAEYGFVTCVTQTLEVGVGLQKLYQCARSQMD